MYLRMCTYKNWCYTLTNMNMGWCGYEVYKPWMVRLWLKYRPRRCYEDIADIALAYVFTYVVTYIYADSLSRLCCRGGLFGTFGPTPILGYTSPCSHSLATTRLVRRSVVGRDLKNI